MILFYCFRFLIILMNDTVDVDLSFFFLNQFFVSIGELTLPSLDACTYNADMEEMVIVGFCANVSSLELNPVYEFVITAYCSSRIGSLC